MGDIDLKGLGVGDDDLVDSRVGIKLRGDLALFIERL